MLDYSEVSYGCDVTSYGQCQWVIGKGFITYGPVDELMTCCWSSGKSSRCTFGVSACTFYRTHSWVVSGSCYGINWFWQGKVVLVSCRSRNYLIRSVRHSIDSYAVTCIAASCIGSDI